METKEPVPRRQSLSSDKEGYLTKQGRVIRNWQIRWFILQGTSLYYYKNEYVSDGKGAINLRGCTVATASEQTKLPFSFGIFHPKGKRTYFLSAETKEDMESWMTAIKNNISDCNTPRKQSIQSPRSPTSPQSDGNHFVE